MWRRRSRRLAPNLADGVRGLSARRGGLVTQAKVDGEARRRMRAARSPPPRAPVVLKTDILCGSKPFIIEGRGATLIFDSPLDYTKYLFSTHHAREWRTVCSIFGRRWGSRFLFGRRRRQAARRLHRCRRAFLIFGAKKKGAELFVLLLAPIRRGRPATVERHGFG